MRNKIKNLIFGILLLAAFVLFINPVSAVFTSSTPQTTSSTSSSQTFDSSACGQGQDFIVQVSPTGCTPVVVRSDLLEEQDVQVYCPLSAVQINPMININSISSISFSGNYSEYVKSVGFYPAQAALNLQGEENNYPLLSNVGYAVINLKQTPNESAMPDSVAGNLTAKIKYDAKNVFGVGNANFYLPELSDSDWESKYPDYGFWNGKGYLRADNIESDKATIKIYNSDLNQQGTATLKTGETSGAFSVSGFNFCSGGVQVKLNAIKTADMRVKLDVNGDILELSKGEKFLDNNCQIISTQQQGLTRNVRITCSADSGKKTFDLKIAPQIVLNDIDGDGINRTVNLGDYLYTVPGEYNILTNINGGKSVFLGYIGTKTGSSDLKDLYVVLVALPRNSVQTQNALSAGELSSIASWIQNRNLDWKTGISGVMNVLINVGKVIESGVEAPFRLILEGQASIFLSYGEETPPVSQDSPSRPFYDSVKEIKIVGFAEGQDAALKTAVDQYYKDATGSYQEVLTNYQSETYPSDSKTTLGEEALYEQITLANQLQQKFTLLNLCDDFRQRYPKSNYDVAVCTDNSLLSSQTSANQYVSVNGHSYLINLKTIYSPTYDDYGAEIQVRYKDGSSANKQMNKDQIAIINETSGEFMQLMSLTPTTAKISGNVQTFSSNTVTLKLDEPAAFNNYVLVLQQVNLKQFAQVSVLPKTNKVDSSADFTFNVSIEKRAIQLSPEVIQAKIDALNASIAKWETLSNTTGTVIQGLTAACEISGAVLTVKNFFENLGGQATARQTVMQDVWNGKCSDLVSSGKYISQDQCFLQNSDSIDSDVSQLTKIMQVQNDKIKEMEKPYITSSVLGGSVVNTDSFMQDYLKNNVQSLLNNIGSIANPSNSKESISTSEAKDLLDYSNWKDNNFNIEDAKNIELYATILNSNDASETLKSLAKSELYLTLTGMKADSEKEILQENFGTETGLGESNIMIGSFQKQNEVSITQPKTFGSSKYAAANLQELTLATNASMTLSVINAYYVFGFKDSSSGNDYLILYGKDGVVIGTYLIGAGDKLTAYTNDKKEILKNPFNIRFTQYSAGSYENKYKDPKVQYFETEPYKGMPAIVPFDTDKGWYAAMKQTLAIGNNIQTYDASARVNSFYLCNVGQNGIQEFNSGIGDDACQSMNVGTSQTYDEFPGLDSAATTSLVKKAVAAIQEAAKAYQSGVSKVTINGKSMNVGTPAANIPSIQCQDFMSPKDCNILFNLCDPVICPSSRCDFGGAYPVTDVVQTGIIGSIALCLPNAREGIVVPVCLTGIQAGMDNWISVKKAYSECLQESLDTGETTGVCDEINSIYMCDFFWQQAAPLANLAIPKITEYLSGQSTRGGGEYMSVQNAFDTAKQSVDYLTNYYGAGSDLAFKIKSLNIGTAVCQNFASLTVPNGAEILNQLTTPDSPPQYTGSFEEISLTTATVPPTSQYKVFYHIYAGKNAGAYYSVYLQKSTGSSFYQDSSSVISIDSGYIDASGYEDQTKDFSASSGYDQLCISVNGQVDCGFQQVSTSLAVNYLNDLYLTSEVNNINVTTESGCISGTASIYSLLNPNIQNAVSNAINPEIYNQGITRVCATANPGIGTDVNAAQENSRWVEVGYCGERNLKCWLDTKNIKDILDSPDLAAYLTNGTTTTLANATLANVQDNYMSILIGTGYLTEDKFVSAIKEIIAKENPNDRLASILEIMDKIFYNNQKAYLILLKGNAYSELALQGGAGQTGTSELHLDNGGPCIADFDCSSNYCDSSGHCADSPAATGPSCEFDFDCTSNYCDNTGHCANLPAATSGTTSGGTTTPAASGTSTTQVTSNDILTAMNHAKTNKVGNRNCNCGNNCELYANSLVNAANANGEDPLLLLSVMMQESECVVDAKSGSSTGLMQISSYSDCSSLGVSSINDVTGIANYNKNIQCGALILKQKYTAFNAGKTYTCGSFTATYSGWDAALRGYLGYGCTNNPGIDVTSYVSDVNSRYTALKNILGISASTTIGVSCPSQTNCPDASVCINNEACLSGYCDPSTSFCAERSTSSSGQTATTAGSGLTTSIIQDVAVSPAFQYQDGKAITGNLYYEYSQGKWYWSTDKKTWKSVSDYATLGGDDLIFVKGMQGQSYGNGLKLLIDRTVTGSGGFFGTKPKLSTWYSQMNNNKQFTFAYYVDSVSKGIFLFKFSDNKWMWLPNDISTEQNWINAPNLFSGGGFYGEPQELIKALDGKDFYAGAALIFDSTAETNSPIKI